MKPLKIIYSLTLGLVAFFATLLIFSTFPIPGNYKVLTVLSGSMEPSIKIGGLVLVKPMTDYQAGDVITFRNPADPKQTSTHRIVEVKQESKGVSFITKGDTNEDPDSEPVLPINIVGKVLFSLPFLGYGVYFVKQPLGFFLLILLPATFIIYDEIRKIKDEVTRIRQKKVLLLLLFSASLITFGLTNAYYSDTEVSAGNTFQATSWDVWVQTSKDDFQAGTPENVDTTTSDGDVLLTGAYPVTGDTVALWHLNEGSGDAVADATGVNNGTRHNFTNGWVDAKFNKGLEFDGSDDYVEILDSDSLDIQDEITLEAWIKTSSSNTQVIIRKTYAYEIFVWNGHLGALIGAGSTWSGGNIVEGITSISDNQWHHVAMVYYDSSDTIKLYVDGNLDYENTSYPVSLGTNTLNLYIGRESDVSTPGFYFNGTIDEVRISNTAKTSFPVSYFSSGTLESQVFDAGDGVTRDWDTLEWDEDLPANTDISFEVATSDNGSDWSSWFGPYSSSPVDLNSAGVSDSRFIKWKATLTTPSSDKTPKLEEVRVRHFSP